MTAECKYMTEEEVRRIVREEVARAFTVSDAQAAALKRIIQSTNRDINQRAA